MSLSGPYDHMWPAAGSSRWVVIFLSLQRAPWGEGPGDRTARTIAAVYISIELYLYKSWVGFFFLFYIFLFLLNSIGAVEGGDCWNGV